MNTETHDVAIGGAGISGLALARHLVDTGRSVTVLEARDRVGGRLESVDGLDVGATWFWPNEPRIARLVEQLGVPTHRQYLDGNARYEDRDGAHEVAGASAERRTATKSSREVQRKSQERSDLSAEPPSNPLDVPSSRFSRGADSVTDTIARELPVGTVQLGTAVRSVRSVGDQLQVATALGTTVAEHAVMALPPALAVGTIEFEPALPDQLLELAQNTPVWMGAVTKVVVSYPEPFWRDQGWSGSAMSHVGPMREVHDMSGPGGVPAALFGFVPTQRVGSATVTEAAVIEQLVTLFGTNAATPTRIITRDWRHEQFTSPPAAERLTAYQTFGHELYQAPAMSGRLHWSSTETSHRFAGHIEGALEAAERTALAITTASTHQESA